MSIRRAALFVLALLVTTAVSPARAGLLGDPGAAGFTPRVPLSAFARPASWFDPSRLHLSSTLSFGTGFSGGADALGVTRLNYQFRAPVSMSVSLGNTFGANGTSFFLEGLDMSWQPNRNTLFRVEMRDVRSPLQYGHGWYGADPVARPF
jgi:hypothetical protein